MKLTVSYSIFILLKKNFIYLYMIKKIKLNLLMNVMKMEEE